MSIFDSIFSFVSNAIKPVTEMIDKITTTDEERAQLKNELAKIEAQFTEKLVELRKKELEAQSEIITAEAKGESWLQRNWRPITMLVFVGIIVAHWLGYTVSGMDAEVEKSLYDLIKIGLGGYVIGRSVEKVSPKIADAVKNRKSNN